MITDFDQRFLRSLKVAWPEEPASQPSVIANFSQPESELVDWSKVAGGIDGAFHEAEKMTVTQQQSFIKWVNGKLLTLSATLYKRMEKK